MEVKEYLRFLIKSVIYILYIFIVPIIAGVICSASNLPVNIFTFIFVSLILLMPIYLEIYVLIKNRFFN